MSDDKHTTLGRLELALKEHYERGFFANAAVNPKDLWFALEEIKAADPRATPAYELDRARELLASTEAQFLHALTWIAALEARVAELEDDPELRR